MGRPGFLIAALAALQLAASVPPPATATLVVDVEGVRNERGHIRFALFATKDGYPEEHPRAACTLSVPVAKGRVQARIEGIAPGAYALGVLHDENGNERLDRNFLGVPREGIGASNNATRSLGAPRFDDARFELGAGESRMQVRLRYY